MERVRGLLKSTDGIAVPSVEVKTIHSFCACILREKIKELRGVFPRGSRNKARTFKITTEDPKASLRQLITSDSLLKTATGECAHCCLNMLVSGGVRS